MEKVWSLNLPERGRRGHRAITTKAKRAYMDELHVSIKHLLKAGVAFNLSNSFNHLFIQSQIE
jgi:hypothetical protein